MSAAHADLDDEARQAAQTKLANNNWHHAAALAKMGRLSDDSVNTLVKAIRLDR